MNYFHVFRFRQWGTGRLHATSSTSTSPTTNRTESIGLINFTRGSKFIFNLICQYLLVCWWSEQRLFCFTREVSLEHSPPQKRYRFRKGGPGCVCMYVRLSWQQWNVDKLPRPTTKPLRQKKKKWIYKKSSSYRRKAEREREHDTSYENRSVDVMHWNQSTHLHLFQLGKAHGLMQIKEKSYYHPLLLPVDSSQRGNGTQEPRLFRALLLFSFSVCVFRTASTVCSMDCRGATVCARNAVS